MLNLLILIAVLAVAGCAIANRFYVPPVVEQVAVENTATATRSGRNTLSLVTWNIGYAGMGLESDFLYDMGEQKRPLSKALVEKNLAAIQSQLQAMDPDVFMLQEVARPSWITYGIDVLAGVKSALADRAWFFGADLNTRYVPPPWKVQIGNATFTKVRPASAELRGLPLEPEFKLGLFRKGYRMHVLRIDAERQWVIINIHLSAFDSVEDDVRSKQVRALMVFAQEEYEKGNHVVIGGDWNLRLAENDFPNTTEEKFKFWIRDFPAGLVPEGWNWAADAAVPTVRTAHKPYVAGENYTLTIDGFLASPNVKVKSVKGIDLGFEHTDHHPVLATFIAQ